MCFETRPGIAGQGKKSRGYVTGLELWFKVTVWAFDGWNKLLEKNVDFPNLIGSYKEIFLIKQFTTETTP